MSYWQKGCDDAKAGKPADPKFHRDEGYMNGFNYGQGNPRSLDWPELWPDLHRLLMPRPPLKNPYMEGIEATEGILQRLNTFHKEFPGVLSGEQRDEYMRNLLEIRDRFHEMQREDPYGE